MRRIKFEVETRDPTVRASTVLTGCAKSTLGAWSDDGALGGTVDVAAVGLGVFSFATEFVVVGAERETPTVVVGDRGFRAFEPVEMLSTMRGTILVSAPAPEIPEA